MPKPVSLQGQIAIKPIIRGQNLEVTSDKNDGKASSEKPPCTTCDIDHAEAIFQDNPRARELNTRLKKGESLSKDELAELRNYISSQMPRLLNLMAWNMAGALCSMNSK